jgi:hypothetical protein
MNNKNFNKVLLDSAPFFRQVNKSTIERDPSSLAFIIEEIISFGAIEIAIPAKISLSAQGLDCIHPLLRKRVKIIDKDDDIYKKASSINSPILNEFGFKGDFGRWHFEKSISGELKDALSHLHSSLYFFLLGLYYDLQIDFDINTIMSSILTIKKYAKDPLSRLNLSTLLGIFSSYELVEVGTIITTSNASDDLIQIFDEFVHDQQYRELSFNFHELGHPMRIKKSIHEIGQLSRILISKRSFKPLINFTAKLISAATKIPITDSELGESLLSKKYLPSVISLYVPLSQAHERWKRLGSNLQNSVNS